MRRVCTSSAGPISGTWWSPSARTAHRSRASGATAASRSRSSPHSSMRNRPVTRRYSDRGQVVALEIGIERFEVGLEDGHAASTCGVAVIIDLVPCVQGRGSTDGVERTGRTPSRSSARLPSAVRPRVSSSSTWSGTGAPASSLNHRAAVHPGTTVGTGRRRPSRAACDAVTAPGPTTLTGPWTGRRTAASRAAVASSWCSTENGGSASPAERHGRHAQVATERAREVRDRPAARSGGSSPARPRAARPRCRPARRGGAGGRTARWDRDGPLRRDAPARPRRRP